MNNQTCSFKYCYYKDPQKVIKDKIDVRKFKCDSCNDAYYHSEFCKKLDKDHLKKCANGLYQSKDSTDFMGIMKSQPTISLDQSAVYDENDFNSMNTDPKNISLKNFKKIKKNSNKKKIVVKPFGERREKKKKKCSKGVMMLNGYEIFTKKILGEGSYGTVVYSKELLTNEEVAIKVVDKNVLSTKSQSILLKREIYIQRKLKHQNILALKDVFEDEDKVYLVLEYASGGSLFDYIQNKRGLSERESFIYFLQCCLAVDTLHKNNIIHRDIKPENLLMDKAKKLKLCDFGCSFQFLKKSPKIRKTFCGTIDYMAPEFFRKTPHGMPADVWALGVLVYEMVHAQPPFDTMSENEKVALILDCDNQDIPYRPGISEDFKDMISFILRCNPKERPGFDEIFEHPWVKKYEKKLNINIQRLRYKDSILGDYAQPKKIEDFFSKCELRHTEVLLYADDDYLEEEEKSQYESTKGYGVKNSRDFESSTKEKGKEKLEDNYRSSSIKFKTAVVMKHEICQKKTGLSSTRKNLDKELDRKITKSGKRKENTTPARCDGGNRYNPSTDEKDEDEKSVAFLLKRADSIGESFLSKEKGLNKLKKREGESKETKGSRAKKFLQDRKKMNRKKFSRCRSVMDFRGLEKVGLDSSVEERREFLGRRKTKRNEDNQMNERPRSISRIKTWLGGIVNALGCGPKNSS